MLPDQPAHAPANRLSREKSPYLLQHAHNPVDWYPWGKEAFARAKQENKPIFLSIGYSTCHWCHVMERESFESPEIAQLLNRWFVCIKVDREEHPDVDHVYMSAVTAMTGQGGWPLTVFLTPELKPFFGGTYFPPERRWQMAGMKEILPAVAEAWQKRPQELIESSQQLTSALAEHSSAGRKGKPLTAAVLDAAFNQAVAAFDEARGGFGQAPKFPRSHELSFLLRYWKRTQSRQALEMVTTTLDHLQRGGIYDHLGGGFHRYSTDAQWLVPHFEKMLYDQALLAITYLEAYRATKNSAYAQTARGICDYVLRDLRDPQGGFYSAEDADSEGEEGKFYAWKPDEIESLLGREQAAVFNAFYGITAAGNFEHNTSILHIEQPLEAYAALKQMTPDALNTRLAESRAKLFAQREKRIRPHRDDKILTSWNGLMIAALAYAGSTLDEPRYRQAAVDAARFILAYLRNDEGLLRRYRQGEARFKATLEDYAFLSWGLFELYESTGEALWLKETKWTVEGMIERFWDKTNGGFFLKDQREEPLIIQSKEPYDGATPSGNSVAAVMLVRLSHLLNDPRLSAFAQQSIDAFADSITQAPFGYPQMLNALDAALGPAQELVIAGSADDPGFLRLLAVAHQLFLPSMVIAYHGGKDKPLIERLLPWIASQNPQQGKPTAYLCEGYACRLPVTDAEALAGQLQRSDKPSPLR